MDIYKQRKVINLLRIPYENFRRAASFSEMQFGLPPINEADARVEAFFDFEELSPIRLLEGDLQLSGALSQTARLLKSF
ncbi:MAG: hypothetical protein LBQ12_12675, partial [Deltaproteobacteria bacterium]|nr:hypothetical protein [Deltaproteobacteria bacterium]